MCSPKEFCEFYDQFDEMENCRDSLTKEGDNVPNIIDKFHKEDEYHLAQIEPALDEYEMNLDDEAIIQFDPIEKEMQWS